MNVHLGHVRTGGALTEAIPIASTTSREQAEENHGCQHVEMTGVARRGFRYK